MIVDHIADVAIIVGHIEHRFEEAYDTYRQDIYREHYAQYDREPSELFVIGHVAV